MYIAAECPDEYENCVPEGEVGNSFIALVAYRDADRPPSERAAVGTGCLDGSPVIEFGWVEGRQIASDGAVLSIRLAGQGREEGTSFWLAGWSDNLEQAWLNQVDSAAVIGIIKGAERLRQNVTIEASGGPNGVVADFNVRGFTTNFQRLPCSN